MLAMILILLCPPRKTWIKTSFFLVPNKVCYSLGKGVLINVRDNSGLKSTSVFLKVTVPRPTLAKSAAVFFFLSVDFRLTKSETLPEERRGALYLCFQKAPLVNSFCTMQFENQWTR